MVYTVTLNPALDYFMKVDSIVRGDVSRSSEERICHGGKGTNVSLVLNRLGVENVATGVACGATGEKYLGLLSRDGIKHDFVKTEDRETRINVKIKSSEELDVSAAGPELDASCLDALFDKLGAARDGDVAVLAGSLPRGLPADTYGRIISRLSLRGVRCVLDTSGGAFLEALKYKPFLVKPNHHELGAAFGAAIETKEDAFRYAEKAREAGAENVLVSLAERGAVLLDESCRRYAVDACRGGFVNSTGCGDSMLAGFIAGFLKRGDFAEALRLGVAAGCAAAFSEGLAKAEDIYAIYDRLNV
ncbi:MAG: 1-phosphofructokinase [Clostridia bacterium]|nr:1-phosphofructokinase [Clostridia bacterium]